MACRAVHCEDCRERLGESFDEVHAWLDGLAYKMSTPAGINPQHRIYRHHREGVEIIREKFGDKAAQAAEIHIMRDFGLLDNPHATLNDIPPDKRGASIMLAFWLEEQAWNQADPLGHTNPYEDE